MRFLPVILVVLCSCSAKLGREWHENGAPKSLYAAVDLGRDVDAEYVSAASSQTIGQNESTSVKTVSTAGVSWKMADVYENIEKGAQTTDQTAIKEAARTDRAGIESATTLGVEREKTSRALEALRQ